MLTTAVFIHQVLSPCRSRGHPERFVFNLGSALMGLHWGDLNQLHVAMSPGRANPELGKAQTGQMEQLNFMWEWRKNVMGTEAGICVLPQKTSALPGLVAEPVWSWVCLQLWWRVGMKKLQGEAGVGNSSKGRNSGRCEYVVRCDVLRAYRYAKAGGSWFKTWNSWDRAALVGALQGSHRGPSCESQAQGILTYFSDLWGMGGLSGKRANERSSLPPACLARHPVTCQSYLLNLQPWLQPPGAGKCWVCIWSWAAVSSTESWDRANPEFRMLTLLVLLSVSTGCSLSPSNTVHAPCCSTVCIFSNVLDVISHKTNLSWLEGEAGSVRPRLTCPTLLFLQGKTSPFQLSTSRTFVTRLIGTWRK